MNTVYSRMGYGGHSNQAMLEVYIGPHADKYIFAQARLSNLSRKIYWNWAAALGGPVWLFYRKMYKWFFIWLLIGVPVDYLYFTSPAWNYLASSPWMGLLKDNYLLLSLLYVVITNLILGCWGTYLYLRQSEQIVELVRSKAPSSIAAALLDERGAPSQMRLLAGVFLIGGIYLATYLVARVCLNQGFIV